METPEVASNQKRFPIKLPPWHEKRLIWWAYVKGTTKTTLGQNVIQARVEVNEAQIDEMLADIAADIGISVTDLKQKILDDVGFTVESDDG